MSKNVKELQRHLANSQIVPGVVHATVHFWAAMLMAEQFHAVTSRDGSGTGANATHVGWLRNAGFFMPFLSLFPMQLCRYIPYFRLIQTQVFKVRRALFSKKESGHLQSYPFFHFLFQSLLIELRA